MGALALHPGWFLTYILPPEWLVFSVAYTGGYAFFQQGVGDATGVKALAGSDFPVEQ